MPKERNKRRKKMSTKVVGKLDSWDDADLGGSDFMDLVEGENPIRLLTSPYQFYVHWCNDVSGARRKIRCSLDGCPLCQQGEKAVARWYVNVINRKTERCAVVEIGPQIFKQILGLAKKKKWGDPRAYDINIERQPKGSQPLYVVSPEPKEPLSDEEVNMVKEFNAKTDLNKMTEVPTPDQVREKMGMSPEEAKESVDNSFDSDEEDFDFGE